MYGEKLPYNNAPPNGKKRSFQFTIHQFGIYPQIVQCSRFAVELANIKSELT
jgi:hypothetical protein